MNKIYEYFENAGGFLVDLFRLEYTGKNSQELQKEIVSLSLGRRSAVRRYYIRKIMIFFGILFAGILLSVISFVIFLNQKDESTFRKLGRPGYGEGDRQESVNAWVEGEEKSRQMEISIQERKYTEKEKQELLDLAQESLEQVILGKNKSLDEVRYDLVFPDTLADGKVSVDWATVPYGVISEDGSLKDTGNDEGTLVEIQAVLTCDEKEITCNVFANVFPPVLTEEEQLEMQIQKKVQQADARDKNETFLNLPEEVEGKKLTWSYRSVNPVPFLILLTLFTSVGMYIQMDSNIHKKAEERKVRLMLEYPDLMWKMTMLLGAGLSIKGTFSRIAEEYLREKTQNPHKKRKGERYRFRYIYEEVAYTCYEMESGIPEAEAYERFGRRCQLPEYIRLGSVLSQNLKKGAKGLTELLETEAETSLNDRRNHARKIGEQAGTKMLLPMGLMLGIVLVILMVPAFMSF